MHELDLDSDETIHPTYASRSFSHEIPKYRLPARGVSPEAAYRLVHDELNLDGNPALNLASFVTSWMEPQADQLAAETLAKNLIDQDEYPQSEVVHRRVVSMIGRLFHAPSGAQSTGTATIGSSEAIMLAMLAHKRSWQRRREAAGEPADHPNVVMGADVHTCWEKFARYFEVEPRIVPMEDGRYTIGAAEVEPLLDERTIGVAGLHGSTFTGQMDDLASLDALLARVEAKRGWRIPLEVVAGVLANAQALARKLAAIDELEVLNDGSRYPIVIVRARDPEKLDVTLVSQLLRARGWIIPAYTLPPNAEHITVLRMVIKENFSRDMVDLLAHDITSTIHAVQHGPSPRVKRALRRPMY